MFLIIISETNNWIFGFHTYCFNKSAVSLKSHCKLSKKISDSKKNPGVVYEHKYNFVSFKEIKKRKNIFWNRRINGVMEMTLLMGSEGLNENLN